MNTDSSATIRAHLRIHGQVQGVGFRFSAQLTANRIGITGWSKNLPDGSVEAVAEGMRPGVEEFIQWCRRGPEYARVTEVRVDWETPTGEFSDFRTAR